MHWTQRSREMLVRSLLQEIRSLAKQLFLCYHYVKRTTDIKVGAFRGPYFPCGRILNQNHRMHPSPARIAEVLRLLPLLVLLLAEQVQIHLSSFVAGSPCREACEQLFSGTSWLVSLRCRCCCCGCSGRV